MEVLVFDLQGDFAHFRKYYTTTSSLTFLVPPRTAVIGLVGAILGLPKERCAESFLLSECKVGIQILRSLRKSVLKENWRAGPARLSKQNLSIKDMQDISQTPIEVVKEPHYRVFFYHSQKRLWENLLEMMHKRKTVYTPCLGLSEFLAGVQLVGVYRTKDLRIQPSEWIEIAAVAPKEALERLDPMGKEYVETILPNEVDSGRKFKYLKVLFKRSGRSIKAQLKPEALGYTIKELGINFLFLE